MEKIQNWTVRERKKTTKSSTSYSALLGVKAHKYTAYRLRYFLIITLTGLVMHLLEFFVLKSYLSQRELISILLFKVIFLLLNGSWWGALEIMRERIRQLYQTKSKKAISIEITLWLILGIFVNAITLIATLPFSTEAFSQLSRGNFTLYDTYLLVILFQAITNLSMRTIHSGCFAIKRIYRPLLSIIAYEVTSISLVLILLPVIGAFSLSIGVLLSILIDLLITMSYNLNMYRLIQIKIFSAPKFSHCIHFFKHIFSAQTILTSFSSIMMQIESIIALILLAHSVHFNHLFYVSTLVYFITPFMRTSFDWVKLFYFDFKKYSHPIYQNMLTLMHKNVHAVGRIITLMFWLLTVLLCKFTGLYDPIILIVSLPLFFYRSILANWQMKRFAEMRLIELFFSSIITCMILAVPALFDLSTDYYLFFIMIYMLISYFFLKYSKAIIIQSSQYCPAEIPFYIWMLDLKSAKKSLDVSILHFSSLKPARQSKMFINLIHKSFYIKAKMTRLDEKTALVRTDSSHNKPYIQHTAGSATKATHIVNCRNGKDALKKIFESEIHFSSIQPYSEEKYADIFPCGIKLDLIDKKNNPLEKFSDEQHARIFYALQHFLKWPLKYLNQSEFHVCAKFENTKIRYLYVTPRSMYNKAKIFAWQKKVHLENIKAITSKT